VVASCAGHPYPLIPGTGKVVTYLSYISLDVIVNSNTDHCINSKSLLRFSTLSLLKVKICHNSTEIRPNLKDNKCRRFIKGKNIQEVNCT
jgi:hypothetical protein